MVVDELALTGEQIHALRRAVGLSQQELAQRAECSVCPRPSDRTGTGPAPAERRSGPDRKSFGPSGQRTGKPRFGSGARKTTMPLRLTARSGRKEALVSASLAEGFDTGTTWRPDKDHPKSITGHRAPLAQTQQ